MTLFNQEPKFPRLRKFLSWIRWHFAIRFLFTPVGVINYMIVDKHEKYDLTGGYTYIYIFGIRIANIQKTKPWER